jgi:hypothetical protein
MSALTKKQQGTIFATLKSIPECEWQEFSKFTQLEASFILKTIQNQKGSSLETNGTHSDQSSITKFRRLPERNSFLGAESLKPFVR